MAKRGRNEPCHCGSGRKYKKCHLPGESPDIRERMDHAVAAANEHFHHTMAERRERQQKFGHVRDIISADFQGHRFVAIGNKITASKTWRTFPDFLLSYIKHAFGAEWGQTELAKPLAERHPVMQWYQHVCNLHTDQPFDEDGLRAFVGDGLSSAYLLLAYDLYVLDHHQKLQEEVLRRLRLPDQFIGARYELFVAATFIRAGFQIEYEDETDVTTKHPEFVATHLESGLVVSVEAKSRHRLPGAQKATTPGVGHLLRKAAAKKGSHPLIAMIEVSMPPEDPTRPPSWWSVVAKDVVAVAAEYGGHSPIDLAVFTNCPHQYGKPGEPDPARHVCARWPATTPIPEGIIEAIGHAARQYGAIPGDFPNDHREEADRPAHPSAER
jgi:hypothetical protein